jgi:hypothetical protein
LASSIALLDILSKKNSESTTLKTHLVRGKVFVLIFLAAVLDVKLNHILIGYICINAIVNAISFLKGIASSKKMSNSAKVKNLTGCFLVTGAGTTSALFVSQESSPVLVL